MSKDVPNVRETLTVSEACEIIGISRNSGYAAIRRGELPSRKIGRRVVIPRAAFDRWLAAAGTTENTSR